MSDACNELADLEKIRVVKSTTPGGATVFDTDEVTRRITQLEEDLLIRRKRAVVKTVDMSRR